MINPIEDYIPNWLLHKVKLSVEKAVKYDKYVREFRYWANEWPLGLLYFNYLYYKEVIADYINTHGDWGEEQLKDGNIFKTRRLN